MDGVYVTNYFVWVTTLGAKSARYQIKQAYDSEMIVHIIDLTNRPPAVSFVYVLCIPRLTSLITSNLFAGSCHT